MNNANSSYKSMDMFLKKSFISITLISSVIFLSPISVSDLAKADIITNMITNPSVESTTTGSAVPSNWLTGKYGVNTTVFSYPVAGQD